jgi:hypothetical protein
MGYATTGRSLHIPSFRIFYSMVGKYPTAERYSRVSIRSLRVACAAPRAEKPKDSRKPARMPALPSLYLCSCSLPQLGYLGSIPIAKITEPLGDRHFAGPIRPGCGRGAWIRIIHSLDSNIHIASYRYRDVMERVVRVSDTALMLVRERENYLCRPCLAPFATRPNRNLFSIRRETRRKLELIWK